MPPIVRSGNLANFLLARNREGNDNGKTFERVHRIETIRYAHPIANKSSGTAMKTSFTPRALTRAGLKNG